MQKKGHKIIQKDILGRLGRHISTYAGIEKEHYDNKRGKEVYICKDSKNAVPSVPKPEGIEVYRELKTPIPSVPTIQRPFWQRPDGSCYACNGTESWLSIHGVTVCGRCHPAGHERLVVKTFGNA